MSRCMGYAGKMDYCVYRGKRTVIEGAPWKYLFYAGDGLHGRA